MSTKKFEPTISENSVMRMLEGVKFPRNFRFVKPTDNIIEHYAKRYEVEQHSLREVGKWLFSLVTLPLLGFGAINFARTNSYVMPGHLQVREDASGNYIVLPPGRHNNFPWESYATDPIAITSDDFTLGNERIVRVKPGSFSVRVVRNTGEIEILEPGRHIIDISRYQYHPAQLVSNHEITFPTFKIVTVKPGWIAAMSNKTNGEVKLLHPGRHFIDTTQFDYHTQKDASHDIVTLGSLSLVTVRKGYAGISYEKGELKVLKPGYYTLDASLGQRFHHMLSTQQKVKDLDTLTVRTTDNIQVDVQSVISYRITDPEMAATMIDDSAEKQDNAPNNGFNGWEQLCDSIYDLAQTTLSEILRRFSLRDLSPSSEEMDKNKKSFEKSKQKERHFKNKTQDKIHDDFLSGFQESVAKWGIEVNNLQIKGIDIKDKTLADDIAKIASENAKADANRAQAEYNKQVTITNAEADKAKALLDAQAKSEAAVINARANSEVKKIEADGQASAKLIVAKAEAARIEMIGASAKKLDTPIAQELALQDSQVAKLKAANAVITVPQHGLMKSWYKDGNGASTFFTNQTTPVSAAQQLVDDRATANNQEFISKMVTLNASKDD